MALPRNTTHPDDAMMRVGSDVAAALATVLPLHGAKLGAPAHGEIAMLPEGIKVQSIKALVDEWRAFPERRLGTAVLDDVDSFIEHVNRFKDGASAIFAKMDETAPSFTAVLDYHRAGPPEVSEAARWGKHRSVHKPIVSEVWKAWKAVDGKPLTQREFASLLEDRILDIAPPLTPEELRNNAMITALGGRVGTQQDLLTTSRGLRVKENAEVTNAQVLETGEVEVVYKTELRDNTGQPLRLPTCFAVQGPVFEGGPAYRLWLRIRFRRDEGAIMWTLARWRPDLIVRDALNEMRDTIAGETILPVLIGTPE